MEESLSDFMHLHQNEEEIRKNEEHKKNEERKKEEEERKKEEIMLKFANEVMLGLEKRAENEEIKQKNNVFVEFDLN